MSSKKVYWKSVAQLDESNEIVNKLEKNEFVEKIPIERVNAKPFIGPSPRRNKQKEAIRVVIFASKIVERDFSKPTSIAINLSFPFSISSRILS